MEKYHFCTASVGADGLAGFHIPLHMSLLWDFPFLALLLLLAIYSVSVYPCRYALVGSFFG